MCPSMTKNTIIVCGSPLQIIIAIHLCLTVYKDNMVDLVISNSSDNGGQIIENAKKSGLFRNVIHLNVKVPKKSGNNLFNKIAYSFKRLIEILENYRTVRQISKIGKYDVLSFSNISTFSILLYNKLLRKNKKLELNLFEDGLSSYRWSFIDSDKPDSLHRKWINPTGIIHNVKKLYLFNEELLEWDLPNGDTIPLEKMDIHNKLFTDEVNIVFGTSEIADKYDRKIIFFEESHFADGFQVPDVELVNEIANRFGKENIMVKIHPRNPVNRFAKLGYKTNTNTSIPWEAIVLNQDFSDKILVTISSGSVIYPYLYFGIDMKSYSLLNCLDEKPGFMKGDLGTLMQKIYDLNPDVFFAPKTMEELLNDLSHCR